MEIELIKATATDKKFLLDLRKQTMIEHLEKAGIYLSKEEHVARVNKHFEGSFIILKSKKKVGLLKCIDEQDTIEILQLQVSPQYQGVGIGKYIIQMLISKANTEGKKLTLKVLKENPARYLYERAGFKITEEDDYEFMMKLEDQ